MAKKKTARGVVDAAALAASHLEELGVAFALIGGLAVGARGEPRYTRDVDLAIGVANDQEAESLLNALSRRGYSVDTVIEQTRTGRLATARLRHPVDPDVFIDLLFASRPSPPHATPSMGVRDALARLVGASRTGGGSRGRAHRLDAIARAARG
jgi:hypothetical protein